MTIENENTNEQKKKQFINTSGQGVNALVPDVVKKKFNWGAFLLSFIWGLFHKKYITLLIIPVLFIPYAGLFIAFVLTVWFGIKGNEWAWRNKKYDGIRDFHDSQRSWAIAGIVVSVLIIPVIYLIFLFKLITASFENPEQMKQTMAKLESYMDKAVNMYFESYTIDENENRFYILEEDWKYMTFDNKVKLLDLAAQSAASKKEQEYKANNPNGHKYFSKSTELKITKIYSADNKEKLLGEFYMDDELLEAEKINIKDVISAGLKAYRFYN